MQKRLLHITLFAVCTFIITLTIFVAPTHLLKTEVSAKEKLSVRVTRSQTSALVEWDKVDGASKYKIYKKGSGKNKKYVYIGTVKESTYKTVQTTYRQFVDFTHDSKYYGKKKNRYYRKSNYEYKVVAYKGKTVLAEGTKKAKKVKKSSLAYGYEAVPIINKLRTEKKYKILVWSHELEKGSVQRAKELPKCFEDSKKINNHLRPDNSSWSTAYRYIKHKSCGSAVITGGAMGECTGRGFGDVDWYGIVGAWNASKGHHPYLYALHDDDVVTKEHIIVEQDDDGNQYEYATKKGDITRDTAGICCIAKTVRGSSYYEYSIGPVNEIWEVDGVSYADKYIGSYIRDGKYIVFNE